MVVRMAEDERVTLVSTSPRKRSERSFRPMLVLLVSLAAIVVASMLLLPEGPILNSSLVAELVALLGLICATRRLTGTWQPLRHVGVAYRAITIFALLTCLQCPTRYGTASLIEPEPPTHSVLWALLSGSLTCLVLLVVFKLLEPKRP